jgi:hypothetical protein
MSDFLSSLSSLLQIILIFLVLGVGFYLARRWHIRRLRALVLGKMPLREEIKQAIGKLFSSDVLEVTAIGAVTCVDVAWQYSLADPQIWAHLDGVDQLADPDLLQASLGEHAPSVLGHVADHLQQVEALQAFDHSLDSVMQVGADLPDAVLLLDGQPHTLFDLLLHKGHVADALVEAKTQAASDGLVDALVEAKAQAASDGLVDTLVEAKAQAASDGLADALVEAKVSVLIDNADLWHHVPLITIGFATYRAWRRAEEGATWNRNLEFAATEVVARSGGALVGAKMGSSVGATVGMFTVPAYGIIIGSVVGAVGGAIAGARLSEKIKHRHVRRSQRELDAALHNLGAPYLQDPVGYRKLTTLFAEQEQSAQRNIRTTQRQYTTHARWWRRLWPDQKLILLQETVRAADERLLDIRQQVRDTLERVEMLRQQNNYKALGLILWNAPGMCQQLGCAMGLVRAVNTANEELRRELQQLGIAPA